jgi:hypothetical protein
VNDELTPDDRALLAAIAALERASGRPAAAAPPAAAMPGGTPGAAQDGGDSAAIETLTRLYQETLGLVPFGLAPAAPPPEVKGRLMALVATGEAGAQPLPSAHPTAGRGSARDAGGVAADVERPAGLRAPPSAGRAARAAPPPLAGQRRGPSRWPLALAAALILALLAAGGWLYRGLLTRGETIARLATERNAALRHAADVEARLDRLTSQVRSLRDGVSVVTSPAVEVCNLRAVSPEMADARGIMFVAADHQHWYLSLRGLPPAGSGRVYQLWFVADQGTVSGGTFAARPGAPAELGSEHMPPGTGAVRITLENGAGAPAPTGPDMLRNADTLHAI